jgi:hypothetical protein
MKFLIAIGFLLSINATASLVQSVDRENKCTLYRTTSEQAPIKDDETVILEKEAYGITLVNLEIDFAKKVAIVQPEVSIVLGLNRKLTNEKAIIKTTNPNFTFLINQLNRRLLLLEKICINQNNEIIYGNNFEIEEK